MASPAILYVDDDDANLTVFEAAFGSELDVVVARSGARALEMLAEREFAVLLVDQRMPGMTGTELAEVVRKRHPWTLRYLVTAYSDLDAAIDAINAGQVRRYIRKPWDLTELRAALREGVELYVANARVRDLEQRIVQVERIYSLGVVAASIAHELRNPALVIHANLELARAATSGLREAVSRLDAGAESSVRVELERAEDSLSGAAEAADVLVSILRGVELSSRKGSQEQAADITGVIETTTRMMMGAIRMRTRLDVRAESGAMVNGSSSQLSQVLLNLLANALQSLPPERPLKENLLSVRAEVHGDEVVVEVEDNGAGIPDDVRERIFDPFFTTKDGAGTGLGLAISRQIVEELGGSLTFRTELDKGTCFEVRLPKAAGHS